MRMILSVSFLVLLSVGLVLGVISHLCTRKKTDTPTHSHENNESVIHGNMKCNKNGGGTAVAQWLRCCATNQKVAGSIPAGVIGIFH